MVFNATFNNNPDLSCRSVSGPVLGGVGTNVVLCKTCSVLLPRVDTSSTGAH